MKDALAFAKQHGPLALIALILIWAVVLRGQSEHDEILAATRANVNVNGQLLMSLERLVYLSRVHCTREAAGDLAALRECAKDSDR